MSVTSFSPTSANIELGSSDLVFFDIVSSDSWTIDAAGSGAGMTSSNIIYIGNGTISISEGTGTIALQATVSNAVENQIITLNGGTVVFNIYGTTTTTTTTTPPSSINFSPTSYSVVEGSSFTNLTFTVTSTQAWTCNTEYLTITNITPTSGDIGDTIVSYDLTNATSVQVITFQINGIYVNAFVISGTLPTTLPPTTTTTTTVPTTTTTTTVPTTTTTTTRPTTTTTTTRPTTTTTTTRPTTTTTTTVPTTTTTTTRPTTTTTTTVPTTTTTTTTLNVISLNPNIISYTPAPIEFFFSLDLDENVIFYFKDLDNIVLSACTIVIGQLQVYNEATQQIDFFTLSTLPNYSDNAIAFTLSNFLRNYVIDNYNVDITGITNSQQIISYQFVAECFDYSGNTLLSLTSNPLNMYAIDGTQDKWDSYMVSDDYPQFLLQNPDSQFLTTYSGEYFVSYSSPATLYVLTGQYDNNNLISNLYSVVYNFHRWNTLPITQTTTTEIPLTGQTLQYQYNISTPWYTYQSVNNAENITSPIGSVITPQTTQINGTWNCAISNINDQINLVDNTQEAYASTGLLFPLSIINNFPLGNSCIIDVSALSPAIVWKLNLYKHSTSQTTYSYTLNLGTNNFSLPITSVFDYDSFSITSSQSGSSISISSIEINAITGQVITQGQQMEEVSSITYTTSYVGSPPDTSGAFVNSPMTSTNHYETSYNYPIPSGWTLGTTNEDNLAPNPTWIESISSTSSGLCCKFLPIDGYANQPTLQLINNTPIPLNNTYYRVQFDITSDTTSSVYYGYSMSYISIFAGKELDINTGQNQQHSSIIGHYDIIIENTWSSNVNFYFSLGSIFSYTTMQELGLNDVQITIENFLLQTTTSTTSGITKTVLPETIITSAVTWSEQEIYYNIYTPFSGFITYSAQTTTSTLPQDEYVQKTLLNPFSYVNNVNDTSGQPQSSTGRLLYLPSGSYNLNLIWNDLLFQNIDYYTIQCQDVNNNIISETITYQVKVGRQDLTSVPITYKNRLGSYDTIIFYRGYIKTLNLSPTPITKKMNRFTNNGYGFTEKTSRTILLSQLKDRNIQVFSDYLTQEQSLSVEDLIYSTNIYIWYDYGYGCMQLPVQIIDTSIVQMIIENREQIKYEINFSIQ